MRPTQEHPLKAIAYHEYGTTERLRIEEIPTPEVGDDGVLIRVHASSVNSWDWDQLRGTPFMNRIGAAFSPRHEILGADVAGRVEAVGSGVDVVQPGDEVFADVSACGWGGFAEYVCARQDAVAPKPDDLTFEQAAAVPQAGVLAWQGLHYQRSIEAGERPDHIVDMTARHSIFDFRRALNDQETYVAVGASLPRTAQALLVGPILSLAGSRKTGFLVHKPGRAALVALTGLLETGAVVPVVEAIYPLAEVPDALDHFGTGEVEGKLVIQVWTPSAS